MKQQTTGAGETIALDLTAPVQGGAMLARIDGQVTFVHGGLPGETVEVFKPAAKRGYLEAEALQLLGPPAAARAVPPCPYFGENTRLRGTIIHAQDGQGPVCGGCQYQHIDYDEQLRMKHQVLRDVLRRVGKILEAPVAPVQGSPAPYHYRNRAHWRITPEGELAYREAGSHTPVPIDICYLLTPPLVAILQAINSAADEIGLADLATGLEARVLADQDGKDAATLVLELAHTTSPAEAQTLGAALMDVCPASRGVVGIRGMESEMHLLAGEPRIQARFLDEVLTLSAPTFFQVNLPVAENMARYVLSQVGTLARKQVLDIYSGAGTFTVPFARQADAVIGMELDARAVDDARDTVARLDLDNVTLLQGEAATNLKVILPGTIESALVDPPRTGCASGVLAQLARIKARRVVYVSCDAATLARDLRVLLDQGYELEAIQPFDMFPQTAHIETIVTLLLPRKFQKRR